MFTGLIEQVGRITKRADSARGVRFVIHFPNLIEPLAPGESIAVNGVCLTVAEKSGETFTADVVEETLKCTTLGELKTGASVNLERSLKLGARLGGHFVFGHVDGVGVIEKIDRSSEHFLIHISFPAPLRPFFVKKGSVALDGISLTVQNVSDGQMALAIVPHTAEATTLGVKKTGARVNIEVDMLARYALGKISAADTFPFSVDALREMGF